MTTKPCLNCGTPVPQTKGRREKKFCSDQCRQKKWQKDQQELRAHVKEFGMGHFSAGANGQSTGTKTKGEPSISAYDAYRGDIGRAGSIEQIKAINKEVQMDSELTSQQKETLQQTGIDKSKTLDF